MFFAELLNPVFMLFFILRRRNPAFFLEHLAEIGGGIKAAFCGCVGDAVFSLAEHFTSLSYLDGVQICDKTCAKVLIEKAA